MMTGLAIFGGILLITAIALFFVQRHYNLKLRSLKLADAVTTAELHQLADHIAQEIGSGSLRRYVKVSGVITCPQPIISELKQMPCVYYTMCVTREYEEDVRKTDSKGKTYWTTERRSQTMSSNSQSIPFFVRDRHGDIQVNPSDAAIDTVPVLDEFRSTGSGSSSSFSVGAFQMNLNLFSQSGSRTIGYRYKESILPLNRQVLVVGLASDQTGILQIERPTESGKKFFISLKSEASLSQETKNTMTYAGVGTALSGVLGMIFLLIALLS